VSRYFCRLKFYAIATPCAHVHMTRLLYWRKLSH